MTNAQPMRRRLLAGTFILVFGQVLGYTLSFLRNVILARLLSKADFGLIAAFSMTLTLLEVSGRMSFGQQIVQSKEGDKLEFMGTSHSLQLLLAIAGSVLMLLLSYPMALAFKVPEASPAFAFLSLVPLARGLENLDYYRQQREMRFLPAVLCEVVPQLIVTLAAWPLAAWLKDFRVIVWLMMGKAALTVAMTHSVATHAYFFRWHRPYLKAMWIFGLPLIVNGMVMFGGQQADQMLVGSFFSLADLATYALALSLVSIPWFVFGQAGTALMLPVFSRVQDEELRFRENYRTCAQTSVVMAVMLMAPLILAGGQIVRFFYGEKYGDAGTLMGILATAGAFRFLRFVPAVTAMARADTKNQLSSNLWRLTSLPLALLVVLLHGKVSTIAFCAVCGELFAGVVSIWRLSRYQSIPLSDTWRPAVYLGSFIVSAMVTFFFFTRTLEVLTVAMVCLGFVTVSLLTALLLLPEFHRLIMAAALSNRVTAAQKEDIHTLG